MPKVGKKEFAYTKAGKQAAKDFAKESGQEVSYFGGGILDARNRSQNLDFNTMYESGGEVKQTIFEKNEAKRKKIADANKKEIEASKAKKDKRKAAKFDLGDKKWSEMSFKERRAARLKRRLKKLEKETKKETQEKAKEKALTDIGTITKEEWEIIKTKPKPKPKVEVKAKPKPAPKPKPKPKPEPKPREGGKPGPGYSEPKLSADEELKKIDKDYDVSDIVKKHTTPKPKPKKEVPSEKPVKTVKTKGGDYPVYKKSSPKAKEFQTAYAEAPKGSVFTWDERKYKKD